MNEIRIADKISKTQFSLFMRQLHALALVQHGGSSENMNCSTMADILSLEPGRENTTEKMVRDSLGKLIEMGFPVQMEQGASRVCLERELTPEEMLEVLPYYLNVVTDTVGIRDCFKNYVENHGSRSLWIIARVYFAALEKKQVLLSYRSKKKSEPEEYTLNPYRWIYRDNAVYLVARNIARTGDNVSLFRLNRIRDLAVLDRDFDDEIPSSDELLKYSVGAFISSSRHNVRLLLKAEDRENIEEDFGHLDIKFGSQDGEGNIRAEFTACDLINVCKAVFSYSGSVRITGDSAAVSEMKRLLDENSVYYK